MYVLENNLHSIENFLSVVIAVPVIGGAIGGAAKVGLGLTQTISALAITLITGISTLFGSEMEKVCCFRASKHILHGMGNIFAGCIESIPFIGLASGYIRYMSWCSAHPAGPGAGNYMAYGDLYKPESSFNKEWEGIGWFHTTPLPLITI